MSSRDLEYTGNERDRMLERPLPHNATAEQHIIGACMLDNGVIDEAAYLLDTNDFYVRAHQFVFYAMVSLRHAGSPVDPLLISAFLTREGVLEQAGGMSFISELTYGLPHFSNVARYAKLVKGLSLMRQLVKVSNKITNEALEGEDDPDVILEHAEQMIFALGAGTQSEALARKFDVLGEAVRAEVGRWLEGKTNAVPTGINELDQKLKLGGLARRDLVYVAARSSRGKTALTLQMFKHAAMCGTPGLLFSLEMSGESLYLRAHAGIADVAHWRLRPDIMRDDVEFRQRVLDAMTVTDRLEIYINDTARTLSKIESISRHYKARYKVGLLGADYTQLVDPELKGNSREQEVGRVSRGFKGIAQVLDVPFIATSQLNRKAGDSERPELENLRESGQQEQDADLVLMPYNVNKNDIDQPVRSMKLYVPKQRNGRAGFEIEIDFDADKQTFLTEQMYADREIDRVNRGEYDEPPPVPAPTRPAGGTVDDDLERFNIPFHDEVAE